MVGLMSEIEHYYVRVCDPRHPESATTFTINALSRGNAIVQAKDGYTGLLGNVEEIQKRLEVHVLD